MKFNAADFGKVIRKIVREELVKALPGAINEVLSEKYIRRLVGENTKQVSRGKNSLSEVLSADDDGPEDQNETPEALQNSHKGIYHTSPLVKGDQDENKITEARRRELLSKVFGDGMPDFFEGTKPIIPEKKNGEVLGETQERFGAEGVPIDMLSKLGVNFDRMNEALDVPENSGHVQDIPEEDHPMMQSLKRRRAQLEVPANPDWKR